MMWCENKDSNLKTLWSQNETSCLNITSDATVIFKVSWDDLSTDIFRDCDMTSLPSWHAVDQNGFQHSSSLFMSLLSSKARASFVWKHCYVRSSLDIGPQTRQPKDWIWCYACWGQKKQNINKSGLFCPVCIALLLSISMQTRASLFFLSENIIFFLFCLLFCCPNVYSFCLGYLFLINLNAMKKPSWCNNLDCSYGVAVGVCGFKSWLNSFGFEESVTIYL